MGTPADPKTVVGDVRERALKMRIRLGNPEWYQFELPNDVYDNGNPIMGRTTQKEYKIGGESIVKPWNDINSNLTMMLRLNSHHLEPWNGIFEKRHRNKMERRDQELIGAYSSQARASLPARFRKIQMWAIRSIEEEIIRTLRNLISTSAHF